jgi:hypothetical protein
MFSNTFYCSGLLIAASLLTACSDKDKETKKSTDFATGAIEAHYSVEVLEGTTVSYVANFKHDGSSLELEGGDVITVEVDSEQVPLIESVTAGIATYSLVKTDVDETRTAGKYSFEFVRETQEDADNSSVEVPNEFSLTSLTSPEASYRPENGKTFPIMWDKRTGGDDDGEAFTIRYDFECKHQSGTPNISSSFVEAGIDADGTHLVDLTKVLAEGDNEVADYDVCTRFDIIAIRSSTDGSLDLGFKNGSVTGSQVHTIKGSLHGLSLP